MKPVYHKHGSSQAYRANAPLDSWGSYLSTSCRVTPHRVNTGARTTVLMSSSTMHCWQGRRYINNYPGDELHMDVCTIPGATVRSLKHAILSELGACYRPLDVLCVFGLNDLLAGRSVQQIVDDMTDFQYTVHRLTPPNATNSIAIATVPIPPKLADLQYDFEGNRIDDIIELNFEIKRLYESQP